MAKDQESIRQTSLVSTLDGKENRQEKQEKQTNKKSPRQAPKEIST